MKPLSAQSDTAALGACNSPATHARMITVKISCEPLARAGQTQTMQRFPTAFKFADAV